jgi:hypothetical protein
LLALRLLHLLHVGLLDSMDTEQKNDDKATKRSSYCTVKSSHLSRACLVKGWARRARTLFGDRCPLLSPTPTRKDRSHTLKFSTRSPKQDPVRLAPLKVLLLHYYDSDLLKILEYAAIERSETIQSMIEQMN